MGLCLLWQPVILLYIIVMYYVVLVWRNKFSSSSSSSSCLSVVQCKSSIVSYRIVSYWQGGVVGRCLLHLAVRLRISSTPCRVDLRRRQCSLTPAPTQRAAPSDLCQLTTTTPSSSTPSVPRDMQLSKLS